MFKRLIIFLLITVLTPTVVYADSIWLPESSFYESHRRSCEYVFRNFYVVDDSGSVSVKKEPGSKDEVGVIENGEIIQIFYSYDNKGAIWGMTTINSPGVDYYDWPAGWVPMDSLLVVYDYISFAEEYGDGFRIYEGDLSELDGEGEVVLWEWPGSGVILSVLPEHWFKRRMYDGFVYTDGDGRDWLFLTTASQSYRNVWVCLSDPFNPEMPAFNAAPPYVWQPGGKEIPDSGINDLYLVIIAVAVLALGTAIMIRLFWKPAKR